MSATTSIQWTDATWNVVTGCTKVSAGCKNCYAFERVGVHDVDNFEGCHERFAAVLQQIVVSGVAVVEDAQADRHDQGQPQRTNRPEVGPLFPVRSFSHWWVLPFANGSGGSKRESTQGVAA